MNGFIVWDKNLKIFEIIETKSDIGFMGAYLNNPDRYCVFEHILNDTKGNKIYADCSIVEFQWGEDEHIIKGYFTFNLEFLQYEIIMLNIQKGQSCAYSPFKCKDFKIIDTVQENKLGLIIE